MSEIVIIGSGPAGVSASLYCVRAGITTTVIANKSGALPKAEKIDNYYGFPNGISGTELEQNGICQAKALGVKFIDDEVFSIGFKNQFTVLTKNGSFSADGIIIATGGSRHTPNIKGIKSFEGKGVSYCAICDAFFFRNKNVAVLGSGEYALHEANDLSGIVNSVTILTNGEQPVVSFPEEYTVKTEKISELKGKERLCCAVLENGEELRIDGLFVAVGVAGSVALAKKIGAVTENNRIRVDENMKTSVKKIYAAGDCTGGLLQISKAVYEGAKAATELIKVLKAENK